MSGSKNNTLEEIAYKLHKIDFLDDYGGGPFWDEPDFGNNEYWVGSKREHIQEKMLFISGPSRNGNHLIHSLLDNHPHIQSLPGEDSFLAIFFRDLCLDMEGTVENLRGPKVADYILKSTGRGINKWKKLWQLTQNDEIDMDSLWSGTQPDGAGYVTDYQDTVIQVDYPAYLARLEEVSAEIRGARTFMDVFWLYLDVLRRLNPQWQNKKIQYLWVGSGMRAEMNFVLARTAHAYCVAPMRPFETYYYSFAKGRYKTTDVRQEVLREAWEHWWHKAVDYLILKRRYPDKVCLVNFNHVIEDTASVMAEICRFLEVEYSATCLTPTTLGVETKGNSSFPKDERNRGKIYKTGIQKELDPKYWPEDYQSLWELLENVAI